MDFGSIFQAVSGVLNQNTRQNNSVDTDGLIGQIGNIFRQHGANDEHIQNPYYGQGGYDGGGGNGQILPASQDPYGDPADQGGYQQQQGNILPASQDPYGDPADQR